MTRKPTRSKKNKTTSRKRSGKAAKPSFFHRFRSTLIKLAITGLAVLMMLLAWVDAIITEKFDGRKWQIPAKVYASPLELYEGRQINPDKLQKQLKQQGYQAVSNVRRPGTFSRQGNGYVIYSRGFHFPDGDEMPRKAKVRIAGDKVTSLRDHRGSVLPLLRLDPQLIGGIYPSSYEDRLLIRATQTPKYLIPGLLAVEDRDFYDHFGLSVSGIARAFWVNLQAGGVVQGGSTLTQQLVKSFYLSNERTLTRKAKEALMSIALDLRYDKDEILETYLNEIYLGQQGRRAIHGFGLASQFYFSQPLQELDLARTALLVGIVKGPSYYNPRRYPQRARARRNLVLDVMVSEGLVPKAEAERSKRLPLGVVSRAQLDGNAFPAYLDLVKQQLRQDYDNQDLTSEGLRIFTHMDPLLQRQAQTSMSGALQQLDRKGKPRLQGAMVVTSAQTGDVLAVVGDRQSGYAGFNRAIEARRPVGSLLKPAIYLTALQQGYTLGSIISDAPVEVQGTKESWKPRNYDKKSHGNVLLYDALLKSYNQAAARLGMQLGLDNVLATLQTLGLNASIPAYPSVLLGSSALSPLEMTAMYQTFATGGFRAQPRAIRAVVNAQGETLKRYALEITQVVADEPMALVRHAMTGVMKEGTGRGVYRQLDPAIRVAGKTGTTNDQRDSWFAGFSDDLLAVVWVGNDDNTPTHLTGSSGALRVWGNFMRQVAPSSLHEPSGDRIRWTWIDRTNGLKGRQMCDNTVRLPYVAGTEPAGSSRRCGTGIRSKPEVSPPAADKKESLLDKFKAWFQS
ncbi:penicillin-binding protein 1B [Endozoicomonadaceae bacterium StTr2]